ncbi:hypothetical protein HBH56_035950 [Parastagonospora nodorum]|nr:hypothetical protein HBH56_035950 [Parastagonospora nodorum]KAH4471599.1 hypothetical protein HBH90_053870 [Parastagonospora nodorum]KAH4576803.1 hypothetical protein HBH84_065710 [Parastagonospora nodorum]KAH4639231.1 hypothetical protein HBH55_033910 [Parastagonospora nodorum]KAH4648162.1 hypothetical protein HBH81_013080 [Parastagonospora nodorum]
MPRRPKIVNKNDASRLQKTSATARTRQKRKFHRHPMSVFHETGERRTKNPEASCSKFSFSSWRARGQTACALPM